MDIRKVLGKRILFADGAMGTMLQRAGMQAGEIPELWNIQKPEKVAAIHEAYLNAGADIIITNTFGANRYKLADTGYNVEQVVSAAVGLVKKAIAKSGREAFCALDVSSLGKLLKPIGDLDFEEAVSLFAEICSAGERAGADLIIIETINDTYELKAAVLAAKESTRLPVFATVTMDEKHKLLTGADAGAVVALLEGLGVDALGVNCGLGPIQMEDIIKEVKACCSIPIVMQPNAGIPKSVDGKAIYDLDTHEFAASMKRIAQSGAWVVGGCCGTTPAHIAAMVEACRDITPFPLSHHTNTVVSSYSHAVRISDDPIMVGERINASIKRFKQAMRENDMDFIMREAVAQQDNGASVLDVNGGLPEADEPTLLTSLVYSVQSVCDLPLQLDTSDPIALERAARMYNGKPMINSVNGKQESMCAVFPIIKKYGGVVIALPLDEDGIPETAQGRYEIAKKIIHTANEYGIEKRNIVVDALAMTISTDWKSAAVSLETLKLVREKLGVYTAMGVSNISFGLPQRENVNSAFLCMSIQSGLNAAIVNPNNEPMRRAFYASRALCGLDEHCQDYINSYSNQPTATVEQAAMSLGDAIKSGLKASARDSALVELEKRDSLDIINNDLIPALNEVGRDFEERRLFLPQLLMSAEAAQAAFETIREKLSASGQQPEKKGKLVLATVLGDIHDIGKNIVKTLLVNYGFEVLDLGKDVPPGQIVRAVLRHDITLVGLSALMTTTVTNMEQTIKELHAAAPECRIMVGGAVLNEEYAKSIGADFYSKDAMGSVHYAQEILG